MKNLSSSNISKISSEIEKRDPANYKGLSNVTQLISKTIDSSSTSSENSIPKQDLEEFLTGFGSAAKFVKNSVPHLITAIHEDNTRNEIIEGKLNKEAILNRALGVDRKSKIAKNLIKASITLGSNPNQQFAGDLLTVLVGYDSGTKAIDFAIQKNNYAAVSAIIEKKVDLNKIDSSGLAPLHNAFTNFKIPNKYDFNVRNGDLLRNYVETSQKLIQNKLIEKTPDINIKTSSGDNVLAIISETYDLNVSREILKKILEKGLNINNQNDFGETALHRAANYSNLNLIEKLSEFNPNPNLKTFNNGQTPLHIAALADEPEIFIKLIKMGADPNIKDNYGKKPFYYFENDKNLLRESIAWPVEKRKVREENKRKFLEKYKGLYSEKEYKSHNNKNLELCQL